MVIWQLLRSTGKARVKEDWERKAEAGTWDLHLSGLHVWEMEADWIEQIKCRRMKLKEMNEPERKGRERCSRAF